MKNILALTLTCACLSADVDHTTHWDGQRYHFNSEEQFSAAKRIVENLPLKDRYYVLDIGSGDGRITAMIQDKLKTGKVFGIDINRSMVEFARKQFPDIGFYFSVEDANRISWEEDFDMIVSFSTLQWIPNQEAFLPRVHTALRAGRHFISDTPQGLPDALQAAVDTVVQKEHWASFFVDYAPNWRFFEASEYKMLLEASGFEVLVCESKEVPHTFPSKEAFKGFIMQWFPYLTQLPTEYEKDAFMREVIDTYVERLERVGEEVPFPVRRLSVDAIKQ